MSHLERKMIEQMLRNQIFFMAGYSMVVAREHKPKWEQTVRNIDKLISLSRNLLQASKLERVKT